MGWPNVIVSMGSVYRDEVGTVTGLQSALAGPPIEHTLLLLAIMIVGWAIYVFWPNKKEAWR